MAKQQEKIECILTLNDTQVVITGDQINGNGRFKLYGNGELTQNELSAIAEISSLIRQLANGKDICYSFDPEKERDTNRLVLCEWGRDGAFRVKKPHAKRKFCHAATVQEALGKRRGFTCTWELAQRIPKNRETMVTK